MLDFLQTKHLHLLKSHLKDCPSSFSEYSCANLYLFRDVHHYQIETSFSFLTGIDRKKRKILIPLQFGDFEKTTLPQAWIEAVQAGSSLYPLTQEQAQKIGKLFPFPTTCFYEPEDSDYLFKRDHLSELKGRHLSSKRNLIHQLLHQYSHCHLQRMQEDDKEGLFHLLEIWQNTHSVENDISAFLEGFELRELLELEGFVLKNEDKIIGASLGERHHSSWLYHFAKIDPSYKGATAFLYQETAKAIDPSLDWINMEQDLGLPGLRQAKHSFQPQELLAKWRVASTKTL